MLRVTLRNLFARKVRLLLSAFSIVLGVSFVTGSFVFTDAMNGAFSTIIRGSVAPVEVAAQGSLNWESTQSTTTIDRRLADRITATPGVGRSARGVLQQGVFLLDRDGEVIGGNGPPGLASNNTSVRSLTGVPILTLADGRWPRGRREVVLESTTAERSGYDIGDAVTVVTTNGPTQVGATVTGVADFSDGQGMNGGTLVVWSTGAMQDLFYGGRDVYTGMSIEPEPGARVPALVSRLDALLPDGLDAVSGEAAADENQASVDQVVGFINTFFLVFAGISLVVGTFIVINTFTILVAQRSRELALLRALGSSRRQVTRAVMIEAFVVGLVGSLVGLGVGYLLAHGLAALMSSFGLDLAGASLTLAPRTVVVSLLVGVVVTLVAAFLPARRASRVAPVAAMRDDLPSSDDQLGRRVVVGAGIIGAGLAVSVAGFLLEGGWSLGLVGLGMLLVLVGVAVLTALIGRPVVGLLGWVFRALFATTGLLASQNAVRNPRRTAATASALMIGLTLVGVMSTLGQSASDSIDKTIRSTMTSDYVVSNAIGQPFNARIGNEISRLPSVADVSRFRTMAAEANGSDVWLGGVEPASFAASYRLGPLLTYLRPGTMLVTQQGANQYGWSVGDRVVIDIQGTVQRVRISGIDPSNALPAPAVVTQDTLEAAGVVPQDSMLFLTQAPGVDSGDLATQVERITDQNPMVTLQTPEDFAEQQKAQVDIFLSIIYALLGFAILIAILGIINTLALSVIERTREIGLLRAVGLSRPKTMVMVLLESVTIAVLGATLGLGLGLAFGVALQRQLADDGITVLGIDGGLVFTVIVASVVVGMVASVLPAVRAARLDVLRAISTE